MSISPKVLSGKEGTIGDMVLSGVVHVFWNRSRVNYGEEVVAGCLVSGWPDGTAVKLKIFEKDSEEGTEQDDPVTTLDASLDRGLASKEWKVEYEDPDDDEGGEYEMYIIVEIDGEAQTLRDHSPLLLVDLMPPLFSF